MAQTASGGNFIAVDRRLLVAFELGWSRWRLAFGSAVGERAWQVTIPARNVVAVTGVDPGQLQVVRRRWGGDEPQDGLGYGTQPGNAAACFTHVAICASSSSSPSWMSM